MARTRRRKRHTQKADAEGAPAQGGGVPRSFVLKRGRLAALVDELADDVRKVMEPHTAKNLKERKQNKLKDFIHVAGPLGVSHFVLLSATERSRYLRIAKAPRGPTATWRVTSYAHASDIAAAQTRPRAPESAFRTPPLVVLNNFGTEPHMKLAAIMFQNMFPPVNVNTVKLAATQRVLLVDYDRASGRFRLRHYSISAKQLGVNRRLRRLLTKREVPDLGGCADVADFLARAAGDASDSEGEDGAAARVTLAQDVRGAGNTSGSQSAIRLQEIGPRMDLELLKVEEGLCGGAVLYHAHVSKTAEEAARLEREAREKEASKIARRAAQDANVERKREANEAREAARAAAREARMAARQAAAGEEGDADEEDAEGDYGDEEEDEEEEEEPARPARASELLSVVVDVSPTMHADLPVVSAALTEFLHKKLLFGKAGSAQMELQLSGSDTTDNNLTRKCEEAGDCDQYTQQHVLLPFGPLTHVEVQWADRLADYPGSHSSNFMDALSVAQYGLDAAKKDMQTKSTSRIIFISDLCSDRCNADDADDAEFLKQLAPALKTSGITLECHYIPRPDASAADATRAAAARRALHSLVEDADGEWIEEPANDNMLRAPFTETVSPSTISRIDLEIGSQVKIPVFLFKATTEAKVPSLKMYNKAAADRGDSPAVKRETEYLSKVKQELSLEITQVISAYPYGKSIVPMDNAEKALIEFKPMPHAEDGSSFKGMQLLGFTPAKTLPLYLNLKSADYVLPAPMRGHPSGLWDRGPDATTAARSAAGISALARAMHDTNSVGVVRYALRKNSDLHLGVLSPVLNERGNYLSLNVLPFEEDLRMHEFAPLQPEPAAEACAAAESLIDSMMFGNAAAPPNSFAATGDWQALHNPTIRRFYGFMKQLAVLEQGAEVPQIPVWDVNMLPQAVSSPAALAAVEAFNTHAPTRAAEKRQRGAGAHGSAEQDGGEQDDSKRQRDSSQPAAFGASSGIKISNRTAVADFERELAAASGKEYAATANVMEAMTALMADLATFHTSNEYPVIIDCLRAMRRACIQLDMSPTYYHALSQLIVPGLWAAIKAVAGLGPITTDELPETKTAISAEEAAAFMAREPAEAVAAQDTDNEDAELEFYDDAEAGMD